MASVTAEPYILSIKVFLNLSSDSLHLFEKSPSQRRRSSSSQSCKREKFPFLTFSVFVFVYFIRLKSLWNFAYTQNPLILLIKPALPALGHSSESAEPAESSIVTLYGSDERIGRPNPGTARAFQFNSREHWFPRDPCVMNIRLLLQQWLQISNNLHQAFGHPWRGFFGATRGFHINHKPDHEGWRPRCKTLLSPPQCTYLRADGCHEGVSQTPLMLAKRHVWEESETAGVRSAPSCRWL